MLNKGEISAYEKRAIEEQYKSDRYADWELLITDLINHQCGVTDTTNLYDSIESEVIIKSSYNKADSANILGAIGFSNICFNEDFTFGIFFFQKESNEWKYVDELGLGIS